MNLVLLAASGGGGGGRGIFNAIRPDNTVRESWPRWRASVPPFRNANPRFPSAALKETDVNK